MSKDKLSEYQKDILDYVKAFPYRFNFAYQPAAKHRTEAALIYDRHLFCWEERIRIPTLNALERKGYIEQDHTDIFGMVHFRLVDGNSKEEQTNDTEI